MVKMEGIVEIVGANAVWMDPVAVLNSSYSDYKSDVSQVHQLIADRNQDTGTSNPGYKIIVIDPPWENKSVRRHSLYPMMPNKQLFSLPVKQLAHKEGALVALWLTNREKLHQFVEKDLFPSWGVKLCATWYWLKLNKDAVEGGVKALTVHHGHAKRGCT